MTAKPKPKRGSNALDYQMVQYNGVITLNKRSRQAMGIKSGDWVAIYPGSKPGVLILRVAPHIEFEPEPEESSPSEDED